MRKEESMKWPFKSEDMADNLIEWAGKIKALGDVWGSLSWHEARGEGSTDTLERCGEMLGSIIGDYAGFIEDTVTENLSSLRDLDKMIISPLARCREVYDFLKESKRPEDILAIDLRLNELTTFIKGEAVPAMKLKEDLLALRNRMAAKNKETAVTESPAAA